MDNLDREKEEQEIINTIRQRLIGVATSDRELLAPLFHEHYFYITSSGSIYNKQNFLDWYTGQSGPRNIPTTPDIISIEIDGAVATVISRVEGTYVVDGKLYDRPFQTSHTLVKHNGKWIFLAGHYI